MPDHTQSSQKIAKRRAGRDRLCRVHALAAAICLVALIVGGISSAADPTTAPDAIVDPTAEGVEFFERQVRPLLVEHCQACHGQGKKKGGLNLESRVGLLAGGDSGPAVVPGKPDNSLLIEAIRYGGETFQMPPRGKLADEKIAILTRWVAEGAAWPQEQEKGTAQAADNTFNLAERAKYWSFQPLVDPPLPAVRQTDWPISPIDFFILARLEAAGLQPAPPADRRTLLRRATFDLIGLPPTAEEIEAFLADSSPDAFAHLVDRLLASPHYGERWGRHWLDLVRFAETAGHEFDFELSDAFRYRDYVIRAFNADVPYDRFVLEHIAGDLLPDPRRHPTEGFNESIIGTGFYFLGEAVHSPVDVRADEVGRVDNQIDVLTKTFLGLTVSCARCHDHKFDPITARDYYALAGFLQSSRFQQAEIDAPEPLAAHLAEIALVDGQLQKAALDEWSKQLAPLLANLPAELSAAHELLSAGTPPNESSTLARQMAEARGIEPARLDRWLRHLAGPAREHTEDLFHGWAALAGDNASASSRQAELSARLKTQAALAGQREQARLFEGFDQPDYPGWFVTGSAFGRSPSDSLEVDWALAPTAETANGTNKSAQLIGSVLPPGVAHSGRVAVRLTGALRSQTFVIDSDLIWYRAAGREARIRLIIDGHQLIRDPIYGGLNIVVNSGPKLGWIVQNVSMWRGHRAYIELLDDGPGFLAVDEIRFADAPPPPDAPNRLLVQLFADEPAGSVSELTERFADTVRRAVDDWLAGRLLPASDHRDELDLVRRLLECDLFAPALSVPAASEGAAAIDLADLARKRQQLESKLPASHRVMAMADGTPENECVLIRGNHKSLGAEVPRRFLEVLAGAEQPAIESGSGRLELARRIVDASIPLAPRVMVNRIWKHHFGRGIVSSVDDFGHMGRTPSHPELLDYLARQFVAEGWSIKQMHRQLLLSSTYQMSSARNAAGEAADTTNELLHRMPVARLEAEAIRDSLLAVAGRIDPTMFGPGVAPYLTPFLQGRGRPAQSGPLDGAGRRSVYLNVRRNFLNPLLLAFDFPQPFTTRGRRSVSNVPAQALSLLNNPLVTELARSWAQKTLASPGTPAERVERMYVSAFARMPDAQELAAALAFLDQRGQADGGEKELRAWTDLGHVLFNVKEFIFVQ